MSLGANQLLAGLASSFRYLRGKRGRGGGGESARDAGRLTDSRQTLTHRHAHTDTFPPSLSHCTGELEATLPYTHECTHNIYSMHMYTAHHTATKIGKLCRA